MPSPFPGMDPFLEHPAVLLGLHNWFIAIQGEVLQAALPAPYFAEIGERVWIEVSQRFIEPDTSILQREPDQGGAGRLVTTTTTANTRSRPVVVTVPHDERHEPFLEIRVAGENADRLVTAIELLSPSHNTPGERGRELYLRNKRELLGSVTDLVEIDLLRGGIHTTEVPLDRLSLQVHAFDYYVSIHRADRFEDFLVYPVRLAEQLPEITIPLLSKDADALIDLQAVFDRAYDTGPYRKRIRYQETSPVPPLSPEQRQWAEQILHAEARNG